MKQVFQNKGGSGVGQGVHDEAWEKFCQHDGTKLRMLPIVTTNKTPKQA
jgi:hypothetical protein